MVKITKILRIAHLALNYTLGKRMLEVEVQVLGSFSHVAEIKTTIEVGRKPTLRKSLKSKANQVCIVRLVVTGFPINDFKLPRTFS